MIEVNLYFLSSDKNYLKIKIVSIERLVKNNLVIEELVRSTLEKLFEGPTEKERRKLNLWRVIPKGVKIKNIRIDKEEKIAFIDLSKESQYCKGTSYPALYFKLLVGMTLTQFSSIEQTIITVKETDE